MFQAALAADGDMVVSKPRRGLVIDRPVLTLARSVAIAVFPRSGYGSSALTAPAMAWLRRRRRITAAPGHWNDWELPAIVMLNIRLSPQSASRLRARNPDWASAPKL